MGRRWANDMARVAPLMATLGLFALASHTARLPDGGLVPALTPRVGGRIAMAMLLPPALALLSAALTRFFPRKDGDSPFFVLRFLEPIYLLGLYPLAVFGLHPLGVSPAATALFEPRLLGLLCGGLIAARIVMEVWEWRKTSCPWPPVWSAARPVPLALVLFAGFLALYGWLLQREDRIRMLLGDEPHYLLMMESLRTYGTADLTKILQSDSPLPRGVRKVRPHTSEQSRPGTRYEVHNVGPAILMIPGFTLFGYRGAIGTFALIGAALVAQMFLLSWEVTGRRLASLAAAGLAGLSAPFFFYFRYIYPELPAALCVIYAVRVIRRDEPRIGALLLAGAGAAALPWLHVKFLILTLLLAVLAVFRHFRSWRRWAAYAAPPLPSALWLMWFLHHAYGSWLPTAQYGDTQAPISRFLLRGAPGLLFDRDHGLLPFAPLYFLALPGMIRLFRERRSYVALALALSLPALSVFASHWMWWGGPCPPARFIVPLVPLFVPAVAAAFSAQAGPVFHLLAGAAALATLALSRISLGFLFSLPLHRHFLRKTIAAYDAFPFFADFFVHGRDPQPREQYLVAALWIAAMIGWSVLLRARRKAQEMSLGEAIQRSPLGAVLIAGALFVGVPGCIGWAAARLSGAPTDFPPGATRSLAHLNLTLEQAIAPLERARLPSARAEGGAPLVLRAEHPLNAERNYRPAAAPTDEHRRWIFSRRLPLFPTEYRFVFTGSAETAATEGAVLAFDLCADSGRTVLARVEVPASALPEGRFAAELLYRPDRSKRAVEARGAALAEGRYRVDSMTVEARLP